MNHIWPLQEAQTQLSKLIETAEKHGIQFITCQNQTKVVVLSIQDYQNLLPKGDRLNLVEFFQQSPLYGVPLDLERDQDTGRDIDLE